MMADRVNESDGLDVRATERRESELLVGDFEHSSVMTKIDRSEIA